MMKKLVDKLNDPSLTVCLPAGLDLCHSLTEQIYHKEFFFEF